MCARRIPNMVPVGILAALLCCCIAGSSGSSGSSGAKQVPIVLWHGMGDSCESSFSMKPILKGIEKFLDGAYVKSLCFGKNAAQDSLNGFFMDANDQVEKACRDIAADDRLKDGYHAIGLSQGGQFLRAVAQRCPSPPMKVLVSLGGQHQGVFGLPMCSIPLICSPIHRILSTGAYWGWVQRSLAQAQYWHDPMREERYRKGSTFLADINNDVPKGAERNASYATNLAALERLVLVRFAKDSMVTPIDSSWFGFFQPASTKKVLPMEETALYKEDWIGLRKLDESNRLVKIEFPGDHLEFSLDTLLIDIVDKYLKTTD